MAGHSRQHCRQRRVNVPCKPSMLIFTDSLLQGILPFCMHEECFAHRGLCCRWMAPHSCSPACRPAVSGHEFLPEHRSVCAACP